MQDCAVSEKGEKERQVDLITPQKESEKKDSTSFLNIAHYFFFTPASDHTLHKRTLMAQLNLRPTTNHPSNGSTQQGSGRISQKTHSKNKTHCQIKP